MASRAYRILDGVVGSIEIPVEGLIPAEVRALTYDGDDDRLLGGAEHEEFQGLLPELAHLAATVTPGVVWYAAPVMPGGYRGRVFKNSERSNAAPVVYIANGWNERYLFRTAWHEAEHAIEDLLTSSERAALDTAISRGAARASDYESDPAERRAELFSAFSAFLQHGGRHFHHPSAPENTVLAAIHDGTIGRRRLRQRIPTPVAPAKSTFSDRLVDSLGLRPVADWLGTPSEA